MIGCERSEAIESESRTSGGAATLHESARRGDSELVERLVSEGTDVNAIDGTGTTALHVAADSGHEMVVERLVTEGADVNTVSRSGWTALHHAAERGHAAVVEYLLGAGADIGARTKYGATAFSLAVQKGHVEVADILERALGGGGTGAREPQPPGKATGSVEDPEHRPSEGLTIFRDAAKAGNTALVSELVHQGASPNSQDATGRSALHHAAENGHLRTVDSLLRFGANPDLLTKSGQTARDLALASGHATAASLLNTNLSAGDSARAAEHNQHAAELDRLGSPFRRGLKIAFGLVGIGLGLVGLILGQRIFPFIMFFIGAGSLWEGIKGE